MVAPFSPAFFPTLGSEGSAGLLRLKLNSMVKRELPWNQFHASNSHFDQGLVKAAKSQTKA
jgi:hypothetical protein